MFTRTKCSTPCKTSQVHILSTGVTAAKLRDLGCTVRVLGSCHRTHHSDFQCQRRYCSILPQCDHSRFKMLPTTPGLPLFCRVQCLLGHNFSAHGISLRSPEILDGRVKTLHPKVPSPLLSLCMQNVSRLLQGENCGRSMVACLLPVAMLDMRSVVMLC